MIRQYCHLSYDDSASDKNDKQHQKHAESLKKKQRLIIEIQNRWDELEKKRYKIIADEFNISILTAKKYIYV